MKINLFSADINDEHTLAAGNVYLQTQKMCLSKTLKHAKTMDDLFKTAESYEQLNQSIADRLFETDASYICLGEMYLNGGVMKTLSEAARRGINVCIYGKNYMETAVMRCAACARAEVSALCATTARAGNGRYINTSDTLFVGEIDTAAAAADAKLWLSEQYGDEKEIYLFDGTARKILLYELDRQAGYSVETAAVIFPDRLTEKHRYSMEDLVEIMRVLKGKDGCPWDREQTHETLRPYILEESYEAVSAIDDGDMDALADELGDVLLQIVFHSQIAIEAGEFDIRDVATYVCRKMINRHPHIFADVFADTPEAVIKNWGEIKRKEKRQTSAAQVIEDIPSALPTLMRAAKLIKKAGELEVKINESEFSSIIDTAGAGRQDEEFIGEMLFALVRYARKHKVDAEVALKKRTDEFARSVVQNAECKKC